MLRDIEFIISSQVVCDENCAWFDVKKALNFTNEEAAWRHKQFISGGPPICTGPKEDAESKGQFFVFANYFKFGAKATVHSLVLGGRISAVC